MSDPRAEQSSAPEGPGARPVRVMVISAVPGTVEAFLGEQIEGMTGAGYHVTVVCSPGNGLERLQARGFECQPVKIPRAFRPLQLIGALFRLIVLFSRNRPDVIHTHTPVAAFLGQLAGRLVRVPVRITTVHGLIFAIESRPWLRWAYYVLEVWACGWATAVVCVNSEDARQLVNDGSLPAGKVSVFHVGVNLEAYRPERASGDVRRAVREGLSIPDGAVVFGIVSRLTRVKGILELLEAFAAMRARREGAFLVLVGPVDDVRGNGVSPAEAERFGCADICRFTGARHDVWRLLGAMDVFCLPSRFEGYPASLMEAAAMGLPSITTDIRGCREAVIDGVTGLLVTPRDIGALVAAMDRLLLDGDERRKMGNNARARALRDFDRADVVRKTLDLFAREIQARLGKRIRTSDGSS